MMSHELRVTGRTREIKETLKARGYRWEPASKSWARRITEAEADAIRNTETRDDALRVLRARFKGCVVYLCYAGTTGDVVYRSPSALATAGRTVVPGTDYCDAAGNYIGGTAVSGSAPEDMV
jgi:hypothetical protein